MLDRERHQLVMGRILKDISGDAIAPLLGFKGGTCAYLFHGLPRFSVDLDFDLLQQDEASQERVFEALGRILPRHGTVKDSHRKRNTLFFLLSYGDADHNVKVEVSTRAFPELRAHYEIREYLGIPLLAGKKPYLFASKLAALTLRRVTAMRDIYDIWFFAKSGWDIDSEVVKARTGKPLKQQLTACIAVIEQVKGNRILHGLGEFLSEKEKAWVREHLRSEAVFLLKNYRSVLR